MSFILGISINDFKGEINLDLSSDPNVIAQFETLGRQIEDDILQDLLNDKLYNDLIADLDLSGDPQTSPYTELVDGETYINDAGQTIIYQGLKRMLRYFIYEQYLDFQWSSNASTGQSTTENENSTLLTRSALRKVRARIQNKAVNLYSKAATYINEKNTDLFSATDYGFWRPKKKKYLGKITTVTHSNSFFYNKSSEGN